MSKLYDFKQKRRKKIIHNCTSAHKKRFTNVSIQYSRLNIQHTACHVKPTTTTIINSCLSNTYASILIQNNSLHELIRKRNNKKFFLSFIFFFC